MPGWLHAWLAACLVGCMPGWLHAWLAACLAGYMPGWLHAWLHAYMRPHLHISRAEIEKDVEVKDGVHKVVVEVSPAVPIRRDAGASVVIEEGQPERQGQLERDEDPASSPLSSVMPSASGGAHAKVIRSHLSQDPWVDQQPCGEEANKAWGIQGWREPCAPVGPPLRYYRRGATRAIPRASIFILGRCILALANSSARAEERLRRRGCW